MMASLLCPVCLSAPVYQAPGGKSLGRCVECSSAEEALATYWRKLGMPLRPRIKRWLPRIPIDDDEDAA